MEPNIHDIFEEYKEMMAGEAELRGNTLPHWTW